MEKFDILIIGGGASGLAAAISARRAGAERVAVAERQPRVGKKLLSTGNGRCNILNQFASPEKYFGAKEFAACALRAFSYEAAVDFFASLGIEIRVSENGCAYPLSNQASAVLDCLRLSCAEAGVTEITGFDAKSIQKTKGGFIVRPEEGEIVQARRIILACGGMASPKNGGGSFFKPLLQPFGHSFTPCLPALTPIKTRPEDVAGLKGMKYQGEIALWQGKNRIASESGEILFTESGVSGIAAMQLSLYANPILHKGKPLTLVLSPLSMPEEEARAFLLRRRSALPARLLEDFLTGVLSKRVGQSALKRAGAQPLSRTAGSLTDREIDAIAREITDWRIEIASVSGFDSAQVMLGGAKTGEFFPETMESRLCEGLYAAGEMLDVTGPCGGYNLHWAWASGILAGRSAAKSL